MKKLFLVLCFVCVSCSSWAIDLDKIAQIESSNNPFAYNKTSQARGLYQITPVCLKDYNNNHSKKYTEADLFNIVINKKIAEWYFNIQLPKYLRHYNLAVNDINLIIAYNWGIGNMLSGRELPKETRDYIRKYRGER